MNTREYEIVKILADGAVHSGQELADRAGTSRTAIWKHLNKIRSKLADVRAIKGKGYQLSSPVELLESGLVLKCMQREVNGAEPASLEIYYSLDSTNQYLLDKLSTGPIHGQIVLAEHQLYGRGRNKNRWQSGLGAGIYLSIGWHYALIPKQFPALSLAVGSVIATLLTEMVSRPVGLKWPNDLMYEGSKLGGILIESRGQHAGTMDVVIGIGLNVVLNKSIEDNVEQDITDLKTVAGHVPSRNKLAGEMISTIFELLAEYPVNGFEHYLSDWRKKDVFRNKWVRLDMGGTLIEGTVVDVDETGSLIMDINGVKEKFTSGELSLRVKN
ncbi:MAG: biotin--[acetyl-CoA-carboxylase] ligase [Gammaproteobacteria bacterium]|nr:biotin--[acetyl-CoA-carboxylase] ligase [Gammaproteobacteria bacterium]